MAVCDANYCFTEVDVGDTERNIDRDVFKNSRVREVINSVTNHLKIPDAGPING